MKALSFTSLALIAWLLAMPLSAASTVYVPDTWPTIQSAIDHAGSGDTVMVRAGTYTGTGNKNLDFHGRAITVKSESGAGVTIINCEGSGRGFYFHWGETAASVVDGFTIENGFVAGAGLVGSGGGILSHLSSPKIMNCVVRNNVADELGGGIYIGGEAPQVIGCTISNNTSNGNIYGNAEGGGIYLAGTSATITDCTISGNTAREIDGTYAVGGGIWMDNASNPNITNCTIVGNTASRSGGGVHSWSDHGTMTNCTITGNTAETENGGGIYCRKGSLTITNCIFAGNEATAYGGAIYCYPEGSPKITNCTISGNSAGWGGAGIYCRTGTSPDVTNCILWGGDSPTEVSGAPNLTYCDVEGGWPGEGNIDADPLFADPASGDFHIGVGSPCFDRGTAAGAPAGDLEGNPRPYAWGYDIGAYEFVGTDADADGLPDEWEEYYFGHTGFGSADDSDGDGLTNWEEGEWHTDPNNADTDGDGLEDDDEINVYGTDPTKVDTDGDKVGDGDEVLIYGTDPLDASDTDSDGMPDDWEVANGFDSDDPADATLDADGDLLLNVEEYAFGSDPRDGASPAFIYVDDDNAGDPAQDGTFAHPYGTIQAAIDAAAAPAVVKVLPGTYAEQVLMTSDVWVIGSGPARTVIAAPDGLWGSVVFGYVHDGLLANFKVIASVVAVRSGDSTMTVRNCVCTGGGNGMGLNCTGSARIVDCLIADNTGDGIWAGQPLEVEIINCTIAGNGSSGVNAASPESAVTLTNTILWGNADDIRGYPAACAVSYCDIEDGDFEGTDGNISADPEFVNTRRGDYRLKGISPCIDAGTSDGAYALDLLGEARWDQPSVPNTGGGARPWYDIGAYESSSGLRGPWGRLGAQR